MALAGAQRLAGRRTACYLLFNQPWSAAPLQTFDGGCRRALNAASSPGDGGTRRKATVKQDRNGGGGGGEVSNGPPSREVTAATRQPVCCTTTTATTTTTTPKLPRSALLRCWTESKRSRTSSCKGASRMTPGLWSGPGGGGGVGWCSSVLLVRAYSGTTNNDYNNNNTSTSTGPPLYRTKTGYYDVLGVSPDATHAQIKTAYYRQSFMHHPDRAAAAAAAGGGADVEEAAAAAAAATRRFSDISEAYSVLANAELKKKYDRGLLSSSDLVSPSSSSSSTSSRPKDTAGGGRATQGPAGARPSSVLDADDEVRRRRRIFNFDDFIKTHYGDQLQNRKRIKWEKDDLNEMESDASVSAFIALLCLIALAFLLLF